MSYLPKTKFGDCAQCPSKSVPCVKVKKSLVCIPCHRNNKGQTQISKATQRDRARQEAAMSGKTTKQKREIKSNVKTAVRSLLSSPQNQEGVKRALNGYKEPTELDQWYMDRRVEMTNVCIECGKSTQKSNEKYYRWSICHIVPKSLVPSVATNIFNWVELCQLHHQEFDNTFDKAAAMMCFGEVKMKFQIFKKEIPNEELRKVNPHLLT